MTAWEFLRWFAANHNQVQRGAFAATVAICAVALACWPATGASPLHGWLAVLADYPWEPPKPEVIMLPGARL
jgi:hypothetical protein